MPHKNKNNSRRQNQDIILAFTNQSTGSTTELKNLMAFFDELPFGVFILQKGVFVYANPAFIKIFGCKNESDLLNNPIHDFIHPDDREQLKYTGWNQDASRQKLFRIYSANGQISWVQMAIKSLPCGNNDLSLGYLADLTQTKLRCDYLEQSLDKYQLLFDDVEDVLAEVDLWGNITFVNNSIVKIWGASQEETIGMNYKRYVDKKNERIVRKAYQQIYKSQNPGKITYEIKRIDGRKRFVEDSVSLILDAQGKPTGFRVVSRDVTERKEKEKILAEQRMSLEAIFASVKDAIITVDQKLRVIAANKSTEHICGVSIRKIIGHTFIDCLKNCNQSCCDVIRMTMKNKTTVKEYRVNCGYQGRQQEVNVTSSPLLDQKGFFIGVVLVIRDITLLRNMERELRQRNQFQNIIGQSKKMKLIYGLVESLADLDTTVLVTGESGTGKELVAKALHYGGRRALKPFVAVNCSVLTESLLESELFGHSKGAFTGATKERDGRFQAANGGTILLDEIGDLSPLIQIKLLRVLQEKTFERVGESEQRKVDVRIIACTNRDLKDKVIRGELREDLYYRLKVVEIVLPPLRERREDIPLLIDHFRTFFNEKFRKHVENVSPDVLGLFMEYAWPGNVRELEHVIEHAFVICQGNEITMDDLPSELREYKLMDKILPPHSPETLNNLKMIKDVLIRTKGNKAQAARILGISRQTIYRKIYQYQLISKF